ncbi:AraC family transcriptional regulator [Alkalihalobacterium elongatum]|uniref:AraC family transcriptional regulator n=1 Tax=Alkalihalobacterium elongatum TaxID=2675466 RepID=UPI001C1F7020|nr:AraC family transcriptional regulator [Alkalihalobacterium elongatum]
MKTHIGFCGFSYHTKGYYSNDNTKLTGYLVRLQTEGYCEALINKRKFEIKKGDLLLVKPGDYYDLHIEGNQKSGDYHLFCEGCWVDEWWERSVKPTVSRIDLDEKILSLWRNLIIEQRRPTSEKDHELSQYLLQALLVSLERAVNDVAPTVRRPYPVTRMMRYIEEHATSGLKVEDAASHAGLSVSRAVHLFKSNVGKTMIEYVQEIRLSSAINQMKYTSMTLEHIAHNSGFGTYPYFHRVFKKKYGMSPGEYRKKE